MIDSPLTAQPAEALAPQRESAPIHLGNRRLQDGVVYLVLLLLIAIAYIQERTPAEFAIIFIACTAFGLLQHLGFHRVQSRGAAIRYLLAQSLVVTLLYFASGASDPFLFPFFVLSVQAMLLLTPRLAIAWIAAFFVIGALCYYAQQGRIGAIYFLFYAAVYTFVGVFGYTLRQAEVARRQNEQLLAELRQAQARLQSLAVAEERNRMARDLHDSTKQQAFALAAQLDAVRSLMARDPTLAEEHLQQAVEIADNLRQELATMILDLRPSRLVSVGLPQRLNDYTKEWSHQNAISATTAVEGKGTLPPAAEETLFRITQEALANVARHSQATTVEVRLAYLPEQLTLTIQDDGRGFDPYKSSPGIGQQTMRERAATLPQGTLKINSKPGCGATVTVRCAT